jgi:cold shock CspA family protein
MQIAIIKWFDVDKGFGVIENPSEGEFFLHINNFNDKSVILLKGEAVIFKKNYNIKKDRTEAVNCRFVGELDDWKIICKNLGIADIVRIEENIGGNKKYSDIELIKVSALQCLRNKTTDEILRTINNYYDNELNYSHFIDYAILIENVIPETHLLNNIFAHFGTNLNDDVLFYTWKSKNFNYIVTVRKPTSN